MYRYLGVVLAAVGGFVLSFAIVNGATPPPYSDGDDFDPDNLPAGFSWVNNKSVAADDTYYVDAKGLVQKVSMRHSGVIAPTTGPPWASHPGAR